MNFYTEYLQKLGEKKYRIDQVHHAFYHDFVESFDEITTLPKELRENLSKELPSFPFKNIKEKTSKDGTVKVLFHTLDDLKVEGVLMRHLHDRNTVCVSSQVGCSLACEFCSTGKLGLTRNLTSDEIVAQVLYFARKLQNEERQKVTNIVFMGMGEPFLNYDNVMEAIRTINDNKKLGIGSRHITISTSGIVSQIERFMNEGIQINLAISLHAPNEKLRSKIMPVNKMYSLQSLIDVLNKYTKKTSRRIFYEYIMLKGVNDEDEHARELGKLLQGTLSHVNLIPFNPGSTDEFKCSSKDRMREFQKVLLNYGVPSTIRVSLGQDIDGACGQLAGK